MKKNNHLLVFVVFVLSGCYSSNNVYQSEKTKGIDYTKYKTYAWLPTKDTLYTKLVNKKNVEFALATEVIKQLSKHGMTLDTLHPDCLFTYTLVMNKTYQIGQQPPPVYETQAFAPVYPGQSNVYYFIPDYGMPTYSGGASVTTFRDGSLVIDMIDTKDKKVIWRTSAQAKRDEQDLKGVKATVQEVIPKMFKKFPVK